MQQQIAGTGNSILALRGLSPRGFMRSALEGIRQAAGFLQSIESEPDRRIAWIEFQNKMEAFCLFEYIDLEIGVSNGPDISLRELADRASRLGPYRAVWGMEGAGHYYADSQTVSAESPGHLLSEARTGDLASSGLVPLHTGMGLSLAETVLGSISGRPADCGILISKFTDLCRRNSRKGYSGAAFEALGLVVRNLYPHLIPAIDLFLSKNDALLAYFWHGVGRGIYFNPANFPPFRSAPWKALEMCRREPPHELGRRNAIAGLAWALTLVNIRQPEIMEAFLKHHGSQMAEVDAFANGVCSAMMIWSESAPGDSYLDSFQQHEPEISVMRMWNKCIRKSWSDALYYHRILSQTDGLDEIFRFQDLARFSSPGEKAGTNTWQ